MISDSIFTIHRYAIKVNKLNEPIYLIPFGDLHRNAPLCDEKKWFEFLDWAKTKKNAYYIGMGDYCLPEEAEILTKNGFKKYNDLTIGEEVLGFDGKNTQWCKLEKIYITPNCDLVELKSKSFNMVCSPNHKWVTTYTQNGKTKIEKVVTKYLKTHHRIIISAKCLNEGEINITSQEASLLGWIITDGSLRFEPTLNANITQSIKKYADKIRMEFMEYFTNEYIRGEQITFNIKTKKIKELFNKMGIAPKEFKKYLPIIATRLSPECRKSMLESMLLAEGWQERNLWRFSQKDGNVLETFKILATMEGIRLGQGKYNKANVRTIPLMESRPLVGINDLKIIKKENALAWCPITSLGSWIVKYKNQITITGNSDFLSYSERKELNEASLHESTYATIEEMLDSQTKKLCSEISFMRGRIIGLIEGNHYGSYQTGMTTTQQMCQLLNCKYLGISSFIRFSFTYSNKRSYAIDLWCHHGRGAGRLIGSGLNTIQQMSEISDAQLLLMGHTHKKSVAVKTRLCLTGTGVNLNLSHRKILMACTGSFLRGYVDNSPSYIARGAMAPTDMGVVKIELTPKRERKNYKDDFYIDIHASL